MKLDGRRGSSNVSDRRGAGKAVGIGGGIIGLIAVAVMTLLGGGDLGDVIQNVAGSGSNYSYTGNYTPDAEDERLADLASKVLAGTEDVWTEEFRRQANTSVQKWCYIPDPCSRDAGRLHRRSGRSIVQPTRLSTSTFRFSGR